ncbi:MAG: hypothetical protein N4J56_006450 [Chroococcidiopsis sp. SAG 2025]|uniref:putative baseplate assembly protein n=1 Tax=Chroococcidiopsis sp. SAG 2025 TaxID=171389 RepID=UPI002937047F|nr:putative baseplate assembly protein [Chroococcidiopsis sp. SAG 2025]MDV2996745.1 hypothetical protein [Chroococcidiopsis sp. SAG 2025]
MSTPPPKIDRRSYEEIVSQTSRLVEKYTSWRAGTTPDAGMALIRIFGRMAALVSDRLNRTPEKNFLAFLDLIGTQIQPPQPAQVPLTFELAAGSPVDAFVPARTQVAAQLPDGEEVVFETEQELVVTTTQIAAAFVIEPDRDRLRDCTDRVTGSVDASFPVFEGDRPIDHHLYFACDELLTLPGQKTVTLSLRSPQAEDLSKFPIIWSVWDGATWQPVVPESGADSVPAIASSSNTWEFVLTQNLPTPVKQTLHGLKAAWLRASLHTPMSMAAVNLPQLSSLDVKVKMTSSGLLLDLCSFNTAAIDISKDFFPFGEQPRFNDTFYIASQDGLARAGAIVTLTVELSDPPPLTVSPSHDLELEWEAWTGKTWQSLNSTAGFKLEDGTKQFTVKGDIKFKLPDTLAAVDVGGETKYWIRVRILRGDYQTAAAQATTITSLQDKVEKASTLLVHDVRGFLPNDSIRIAVGNTQEEREIQDIKLVEQQIILKTALANVYPAGASVMLKSGFGAPSIKTLKLGYEYNSKTVSAQVCAQNEFTFTEPIALPDRPLLAADVAQNSHLLKLNSVEGLTIDAAFTLQNVNQTDAEPVEIEAIDRDRRLLVLKQPLQRSYAKGSTLNPLFRPFVPTRDRRPTLYLNFDKPIANRLTALYFQVEPPLPSDRIDPSATPIQLTVEYASPTGWTTLGIQDETQAFSERGLIQFIAPSDWQERSRFGHSGYWLRLRWEDGKFRLKPRLRRVLTNTMWASQTTTLSPEILGSSSGDPNQTYVTTQSPVLLGLRLEVQENTIPTLEEQAALEAAVGAEVVTIERDPTGQTTAVWVRWQPVPDFYGSTARDRHYTVDYLTGTIQFGDGQAGRVPPPGRNNIRLSYQTGGGDREEFPPQTVNQLKTTIPFVDRVTNLETGGGGAAQESLQAMQERGPKQLRHRGRAATIQDFEDLALEASPDVARAKAIAPEFDPLENDHWLDPHDSAKRDLKLHQSVDRVGMVRLLIVPYSTARQPTPSLALLDRVADYLRSRCAATLNLQVMRPEWQEVVVTAAIVPVSLSGADRVRSRVLQRLEAFLHPLTGGQKGEGWRFGRRPQDSDLYAAIAAVPGVNRVQSLQVSLSQDLPMNTLIFSGTHIVQLVMPSSGGQP